jgi:hypothetical protein
MPFTLIRKFEIKKAQNLQFQGTLNSKGNWGQGFFRENSRPKWEQGNSGGKQGVPRGMMDAAIPGERGRMTTLPLDPWVAKYSNQKSSVSLKVCTSTLFRRLQTFIQL